LHGFIWHEFCDWYLELIKPNLYGRSDAFDNTLTRGVIEKVLTAILKLLHPIMPFITEELFRGYQERIKRA
jgi:valyl-tRNA synthetase